MVERHGHRARHALAVLAFVAGSIVFPAMAADAPPAQAAQPAAAAAPTPAPVPPHNAAPVWREVRSGVSGFTTVKGTETGVLVSSQGNTWRTIRNSLITPYGGGLVVLVFAAIALFHYRKGTFRLSAPPTGRRIERFSFNERRAHWLVAISFSCLALTGIVLLFGKHIFLWLLGYTLFSWLGWLSKNLHVVSGFVFIAAVVLMFKLFWRDNLWHRSDAEWIRKAGGLPKHEHVPSGRFNFGEKTWFWLGMTLFGIVMAASGVALAFPNFFETREAMQWAEIVHAVAACVVIALSLGHIYMGTIGVEGALDAMKTGYVDETWAKEHHELWYREELARPGDGGNRGGTQT